MKTVRHWRASAVGLKTVHALNRLFYGMPDRYGHLARHIRMGRCRTILEIGVWDGEHAKAMIGAALAYKQPSEIAYYGFDLFEEADAEIIAAEASKAPPSIASVSRKLDPFREMGVGIHLYKGDTVETLPGIVHQLPPMDFAFIDGGHSYETVSSDWRYAGQLMHQRSVVIFDDYVNTDSLRHNGVGVNRVVDGLDHGKYSVVPLRPLDVYPKAWGLLKIRFVKIMLRREA